MSRKITEHITEAQLQLDLEKYRRRVLELGATDAKVITTETIVIDAGVRAKCINPRCRWYGTSAGCPPYAPDLSFVRKVVSNFHYGILPASKPRLKI